MFLFSFDTHGSPLVVALTQLTWSLLHFSDEWFCAVKCKFCLPPMVIIRGHTSFLDLGCCSCYRQVIDATSVGENTTRSIIFFLGQFVLLLPLTSLTSFFVPMNVPFDTPFNHCPCSQRHYLTSQTTLYYLTHMTLLNPFDTLQLSLHQPVQQISLTLQQTCGSVICASIQTTTRVNTVLGVLMVVAAIVYI